MRLDALLPGRKVIPSFLLSLILSASALAVDTKAKSAVPGTINYVEGQVEIGTETLNSKLVGTAQLQTNQFLTTENGKAEILLTPGVFLRVGHDSSVKMISPSLTNTDVGLEQGHAIIEVAEIHPENDIRIFAGGATTKILQTGLYDFDLRQSELRVYEGKAFVMEGDEHATVKGGHDVSVNNPGGKLKAQKFNKKEYQDGDLYRWSSLRSAYLAEANVNAAGIYAENGWGPWGPGWWGADWYWDPWFDAFTFIPGDGIFYSPFGWGFYSPWWVYQAPLFGYWFGGYGGYGYGYRPGLAPGYYHHFNPNYHNWGSGPHYVGGSNYAHGIYRGPGSTGGFRSGPRMMSGSFGRVGGGGFGRASAGGFHGGGFHGGGFHGGVGFHGGGGFHGR
jgi:FecR protein